MSALVVVLLVVAGGLGAVARYVVDAAVRSRSAVAFPLGTVVVNLTGSFVLGLLTGLAMAQLLPDPVRLVAGTGFLGGSDAKIQLTVTAPTGSALVTKTGSADQHVSGTLAQVSARSGSGDIQLDTITGPTVADTGSGDITVNDAGAAPA